MNILNYLEEGKYTGIDDITQLRKDLFKKKIKMSYEPLKDNMTKRRVILSSHKSLKKSNSLNELQKECNGLILETDGNKWKILVFPLGTSISETLSTYKISQFIQKNLYDIYYIQDGTIINLYYYDNDWVISTSRGYDMNNCYYNDNSYREMIDEILEKYELNWDLFTSKLNVNKSYTFGFRHHNIHWFNEGKDSSTLKLWFIQSASVNIFNNKNNETENKNNETSRRAQINKKTLSYKWTLNNIKIDIQQKIDFDVYNTHGLFKHLKPAYQNFINTGKVMYGFLLISKNPNITKSNSTLLFESSLMIYIRKLIYDGNYIITAQKKNYNKNSLILLNSYLDTERYTIFIQLFPQFLDTFEKFNETIEILSKNILKLDKGEELEIKDEFIDYNVGNMMN